MWQGVIIASLPSGGPAARRPEIEITAAVNGLKAWLAVQAKGLSYFAGQRYCKFWVVADAPQ